jgi:hypothetical protein
MLRVSDFSISWYPKSRYDVPASRISVFHFLHFGTPDDEGSLSLHLPVTEILIFNILSDVPFQVFAFRHFGTPMWEFLTSPTPGIRNPGSRKTLK